MKKSNEKITQFKALPEPEKKKPASSINIEDENTAAPQRIEEHKERSLTVLVSPSTVRRCLTKLVIGSLHSLALLLSTVFVVLHVRNTG